MIDIEDVKRLSVRQGDILVVQSSRALSDDMARRIKDHIEAAFPDLTGRVLVIDDTLSLAVVTPCAS